MAKQSAIARTREQQQLRMQIRGKLRRTADSGEKQARIEVPKSRDHGLIEEQNHVSRNYEISIQPSSFARDDPKTLTLILRRLRSLSLVCQCLGGPAEHTQCCPIKKNRSFTAGVSLQDRCGESLGHPFRYAGAQEVILYRLPMIIYEDFVLCFFSLLAYISICYVFHVKAIGVTMSGHFLQQSEQTS